MATIEPTVLATSLPRNLATGLAFFPANTSLQNPAVPQFTGFDGSEPEFGEDLLNLSLPLFLYRLRCRVSARFIAAAFIGYNLQYTVSGDLNANSQFGFLRVSGDASEGGIGIGLGWDVRFNFAVDSGTVGFNWRSGFRTTWEEVFSLQTQFSIDLIGLAVTLLKKAGFSIAMELLSEAQAPLANGPIWGLYDRTSNQMARLGYLELKPKVALHGNLLDAVAAVSVEFKAFLTALKKIGIKPAAGPVLNIYFPVKMQIVRLTTNFGNYDAVDPIASGGEFLTFLLEKADGPPVPNGAPAVQNVSAIHTHTIDVLLGLAIKVKIKLWSVFSAEVSIPIKLPDFVPALRGSAASGSAIGPFFNRLSAQAPTGSAEIELPEVIWG